MMEKEKDYCENKCDNQEENVNNTECENDISKLLKNAKSASDSIDNNIEAKDAFKGEIKVTSGEVAKKHTIFEKFKIKDIVFLAIMSACMLLTGGVMPLLSKIPVFGIIQVGMGLQFSIFPVIGLMKTRKIGALTFMSVFCGVVMVFMNPIMLAVIILCAVVIEGLVAVIFKGYEKDGACFFAGALYMPLTLPLLSIYYKLIFTGDGGQAVQAMAGVTNGWVILGMSVAVVAVCVLGSFLGVIISRELKKSGVLKK